MLKLSRRDCSFFGRRASVLPRSSTRSWPSTRLTVQLTSSPARPEYSLKTVSRSASRTFWKITCLAVCAEIRPSASVGLGMRTSEPTNAARVDLHGFVQPDLVRRVGHFFHYFLHRVQLDRARLRIQIGDIIFIGTEMLLRRQQQRVLHGVEDDRRIDALLFAQHFDGLKNSFHLSPLVISRKSYVYLMQPRYHSNFKFARSTC